MEYKNTFEDTTHIIIIIIFFINCKPPPSFTVDAVHAARRLCISVMDMG